MAAFGRRAAQYGGTSRRQGYGLASKMADMDEVAKGHTILSWADGPDLWGENESAHSPDFSFMEGESCAHSSEEHRPNGRVKRDLSCQ